MSTSSLFLAAILVASASAPIGVTSKPLAAAPAKLAASEVSKEVAAVRQDAKSLQAGVATLAARKGADPKKAARSLAVSAAELRKDVAQFRSATQAAPAEIKVALEKLEKRLLAFSETVGAIPKDRALSRADADGTIASAKRVMDAIDAVFGLLEPVIHR